MAETVSLKGVLGRQLQTGKARRLVGNDVVVARRSGEAPNIVVAAVEGVDIADEVIRAGRGGNAAEAAEAQGAERTVERQTGFTAEESVFLKCAGVGVKAAFELKADLIAVAEVFRALQAPAGAEVEAGAELKLIVRLLVSNLGVGVDEAFIDHTIKLNIGSNSAARKSAENGERSESLFHD